MADQCPVNHSFLFPTEQECPFDLYKHLREEEPVYWSEQLNAYVVSTYDLITEVINNVSVFSSKGTQDILVNPEARERIDEIREGWNPFTPFLVGNDPPQHGIYRKLWTKLLDAKRMRAMEPAVDALVADLYAGMANKGGGDFMPEFATPLPVKVIATLLGIPADDWKLYRVWGDAYVAPLNGFISVEREIQCAEELRDYQHFFEAELEKRRTDPREDLLTEVLHAPVPGEDRTMTMSEMLSAIQQFVVAGGETTTYALGSGMLMLAQDPALAAAVRENPKRLSTFVEEVLRLRAPSQGLYRFCIQDTVLGGVEIPKGSLINIRIAAANRDNRMFKEPETLDIDRSNAARHMTFGSGIHVCMGAQLARIELASAFRRFVNQSDIALDSETGSFGYFPSTFFMGLDHLHIKLKARE